MLEKIAIVGGGMAGLTAAYELSSPDLKGKYDITVYQMGWRLGGKCATGRNAAKNMRIEEHGIHAFSGSYYNSLLMMKAVYDELARPKSHKLPDFETAFFKKRSSFMWDYHDEKMKKWISHYPSRPVPDTTPQAFYDHVKTQSVLIHSVAAAMLVLRDLISNQVESNHSPAARFIRDYLEEINEFERDWETLLSGGHTPLEIPWDLFQGLLQKTPQPVSDNDSDRRNLDRIEFSKVILRGVRDDNLEVDGFAKIDGEDFDDWLVRHGASAQLMHSPLVNSTMFVTYQFPGGDLSKKPVMSASSFVQWILRTTNYIDAPYYLFEAGSGETLIEPLYELLKKRGVKFRLFHELTNISLSEDGSCVAQLNFNVQAEPLKEEYDPLNTVKGLHAWPSEPLYERLENGKRLKGVDFEAPGAVRGKSKSLQTGKDFDKIILAIPPRAIIGSAKNLLGSNPVWDSLEKMAVTATQSMQIWLNEPVEAVTQHTESFFVAGNYRSGLHGIAEFQNILRYEEWPDNAAPKGLIYFSGVMTLPNKNGDNSVRSLADLKAFHTAETMLASSASEVFPRSQNRNPTAVDYAFDYSVLFPPCQSDCGIERLTQHYVRGNALPSELYTQAPPGTKSLRIDPLSPPLNNLTVAGDWVDTRMNVGSVEGAVIGGRLAACYIEPNLDPKHILGIQLD